MRTRTRMMRRRRSVVMATSLVVALAIYCVVRFPFGPSVCPDESAIVTVDARRHAMTICENGRPVAWYSVRLGRSGIDKHHEGDRKTPLGRYPLGDALASAQYGTFVPIGYPTPAQRAAGLSGTAVGVHGPGRRARWAGPLGNAIDTTDGCVGLWSDADAATFGLWVRGHRNASIVVF